jgi:type II secretory pathway pseudopilin PulG
MHPENVRTKNSPQNTLGFTLVESVISVLIIGIVLVALLTSFVMGKMGAMRARHQSQVMNVLRQQAETIVNQAYALVASQAAQSVTIDPGEDLTYGTADDFQGSLTVQVQDLNDLDGDGDTTENEIDVNGDGINDLCKPVTFTLTWTDYSFGGNQTVVQTIQTLVSQ